MQKAYLRVTALEYIDWFPGFLRCELKDRHGKIHEFVEKIPVVCGADSQYGAESLYPIEITFDCTLMDCLNDGYLISTEEPYHIASEEGITEFEVNNDQVILRSS